MLENKRDLGGSGDEASRRNRDAARAFYKGSNASKSPRDSLTEQRVRLGEAGFAPIPVTGKRPAVPEWQQKTRVPDDEMETWEPHKGTGLLTRLMPALDVDIYNPEAAKAVEELVRKRFEGHGKVLVRIGNEPKFAIPFRTDRPFKKITATLITPEDDLTAVYQKRGDSLRPMDQKIELLCDGQQLVGFGVHPETRTPYRWIGGEPGDVRRDELPEITEAESQRLVDDVAQLLCEKFGYTRRRQTAAVDPEAGGEDWSTLLSNVQGGDDLHDSVRDLAAKLVVSGMSGGAAVNVLRALMDGSDAPHDKRWQERYDDIPRAVSSAENKFEKNTVDELTLEPHAFPDEASIKKWDFPYGRHLLRGTVSATAAMGSAGKSSMAIVEALVMASGKRLLGIEVPRPLRVLLINLEDNRNAVDKRIAAAMRHHGLTKEDIGERLFTLAKGEIKFKIAKQETTGSIKRDDAFIDKLLNPLKTKEIDVLSVDPFIATHAVNENDNSAIREVIECYDFIAEQANCAVHLWHHTRKGNGQGASLDSARGASSFVDACRSVRVLEKMTPEEGKKQKIGTYRQYFRAFSGKLNFAPPTENSEWYHIESVPVMNGALPFTMPVGGNGGDDVGVVEAWSLPEAAALSPEAIEAIKKAVATPQWRADVRAAMWVGNEIAQVLGLDPELDKDRIKEVIRKLISEKVLKTVPGKSDGRKRCLFVVPSDGSAPVTPTGAE
jgi:AAA domain/Bifunctional DNA primase/polymerase, N-terminal